MNMWVRRALHGLHARLLLSYLLVIAVGLVTLYAAASLAAPRFFERQMLDIARQQRAQAIANQGGPPGRVPGPGLGRFGVLPADMEDRVAEGYLASLRDSLALAGGAALATAVVVS